MQGNQKNETLYKAPTQKPVAVQPLVDLSNESGVS